jgi:cobaltochelatase CobN
MHLLRIDSRSLDEAEAAVDLGQSPADILFLSFADSDLALVAEAAQRRKPGAMSLRLANLGLLRHPYSVDLYIEKAAAKARFVLVRVLGGLDYWRYGIEEFSRAARERNFAFAAVPGDAAQDPRLDAASTVPAAELQYIHAAFQEGGARHISALFDFIEARGGAKSGAPMLLQLEPAPQAGEFTAGCRSLHRPKGQALIVFYRSFLLSGGTCAIEMLADALAARGLAVTSFYLPSLKDEQAIAILRSEFERRKPDVIISTTGFSARSDDQAGVLEEADAPVLQAVFAGASAERWRENPRGLSAADLAMNVVLPELDGRLITRAIAFKQEVQHHAEFEFTPRVHAPLSSRVAFVSDLAWAWADLRKTAPAQRRIACIIPDYPGRQGRGGYAIGLDVEKSVLSIAATLKGAGYVTGALPPAGELMRGLENGTTTVCFALENYLAAFEAMPPAFADSIRASWGNPEQETQGGAFLFRAIRAGNLIVALQPDRALSANRKFHYHDTALPPCHTYVAFYAWLRGCERIHALIHCGTHGTLEWLPGKAVALSEDCAPEAVLGPVPVVYPFIVNNPGEAAQAKRRIGAVTIGHMTPPLMPAESHGAALELEALFDEYATAESLDPKRAKQLAKAILDRAQETGLLQESGADARADPGGALQKLDAWLCDLKEMRITAGLHVFGQAPEESLRDASAAALLHAADAGAGNKPCYDMGRLRGLIDFCGHAERAGLLAALGGRFVPPGPGGAPSRGRLDVLPTGRNLYGIDPRAVPTRTAWEIGKRTAAEVLSRHLQDHGEWPRRIIMDVWASATMRTGGDDLAQALALMGVKPVWDNASSRVTGFEIIPSARLGHPRVDVTLRISGLFRDVFPAQIALFDQAVRALSELGEEEDISPLAAASRRDGAYPLRIFGAAPGSYGIGLTAAIDRDPMAAREALGAHYLASASHAFSGASGEANPAEGFAHRVGEADAFIHAQDQAEQDLLDSSEIIDHAGGFAAAAQMLGNKAAAVYHLDTSRPQATKVRTLGEEVARLVRGRASNPRWIKGQMRHGHRGAAEIATALDNLYALAVLSDAVQSRHFELLFDTTLGAPDVREFLVSANPKAARAMTNRFDDAITRGFWQTRRNSVFASLSRLKERLGDGRS